MTVLLLGCGCSETGSTAQPERDPATAESGTSATAPRGGSAGQPAADGAQATRHGPVLFEAAASCVEDYSVAAVADLAFAFDGTVVDIGESVTDRGDAGDLDYAGVTFEVHEWYVGDGPDTFTVDLAPPTEPRVTDVPPSYGIGSRLLVSGQDRWDEGGFSDPIAWGCGFTRYHDEETAAEWRSIG